MAVAVIRFPTYTPVLLLLLLAASAWMVLGPEAVASLCALAAFGFMPFVDPEMDAMGQFPLWMVAFGVVAGIVLLSWIARHAAGVETPRLHVSALALLVAALFSYTALRLAASEPLESPKLTGALMAFPAAALVGWVLFSQPRAVTGLRRMLPFIFAMLIAWAVASVLASTNQCAVCTEFVQSTSEREGLSGGESRLYAAGNESFGAITLIALGLALTRRSTAWISLTVLGALVVALQATRAHYVAFAAGALLLLLWRYRRSTLTGRMLLLVGTALLVFTLLQSAVGDRALSGYEELSQATGNAAYRFALIEHSSQSWSLFGAGVSARSADLGINFDLGLPNTLLALGYVGAALMLALLFAALARSVRCGGVVAICLAAVVTLVLVGRPSLPLLEVGPKALFYGFVMGAICALPAAPRVGEARGAGGG